VETISEIIHVVRFTSNKGELIYCNDCEQVSLRKRGFPRSQRNLSTFHIAEKCKIPCLLLV
jgi:hypothetical protein